MKDEFEARRIGAELRVCDRLSEIAYGGSRSAGGDTWSVLAAENVQKLHKFRLDLCGDGVLSVLE